MVKTAVFDKIKDLIVSQMELEPGEVTPEAHFIDDLGMDSLDVIELILAVEEDFDIEIPDEDAEGVCTVQQAVDYIVKRTG